METLLNNSLNGDRNCLFHENDITTKMILYMLTETGFRFISSWMAYERADNVPLVLERNSMPFGFKAKDDFFCTIRFHSIWKQTKIYFSLGQHNPFPSRTSHLIPTPLLPPTWIDTFRHGIILFLPFICIEIVLRFKIIVQKHVRMTPSFSYCYWK